MRSATDELEAAALALPRGERARLAERPIASLDEDAETELEWANQVRRRLDAYRKGEMQAVDVDNVIAEARRRIGRGGSCGFSRPRRSSSPRRRSSTPANPLR